MNRLKLLVFLAGAAVVTACSDTPTAPSVAEHPMFMMSDGVHSNGNPHFYFLAPTVPEPTYSGEFDGTQQPTVQICELSGSDCGGPPLVIFTTRPPADDSTPDDYDGDRPDYIRVAPKHELYRVRWHTDEFNLDTAKTYRIQVFVGPVELGYADVDIDATKKTLRNVNTGEYIPLVDGKTLPIKFRIEQGALPNMSPPFCGQTIDFTNNTLPPSWTQLVIRGGPGVTGEQLVALPTDGGARVGIATPSAPLNQLTIDYDGLSNQSYWGTESAVDLTFATGPDLELYEANAEYNFGAGNLGFRIYTTDAPWGEFTTATENAVTVLPYDPGPQHFHVVVTPTSANWTVTNTQTGRVVTVSQAMPIGLAFSTVTGFYIHAYETTGSGTFVDNVVISCQ